VFSDEPKVVIRYELDWDEIPIGSLRLGFVTLNPDAFDRSSLYYRTTNGGYDPESFRLSGRNVWHGAPASFLVSAGTALGMTDGFVELGDENLTLRIEVDKTQAALAPMIVYRELNDTFFCRVAFSAREMDDTARQYPFRAKDQSLGFALAISRRVSGQG